MCTRMHPSIQTRDIEMGVPVESIEEAVEQPVQPSSVFHPHQSRVRRRGGHTQDWSVEFDVLNLNPWPFNPRRPRPWVHGVPAVFSVRWGVQDNW